MNETDRPEVSGCREIGLELLDALAAVPDRPRGMESFDGLMRDGVRERELAESKLPVIGQLCNFVPEELILAAGAVPVRLDSGCHSAVRRSEQVLPVDVCCAVRSAAGSLLDERGSPPRIDLLVVPNACDGKKRLGAILAEKYEVFVLDLPHANEGYAVRSSWLTEIRRLVERLESLTGRRLKRKSLSKAVTLLNRRSALWRKLSDQRRAEVLPISGIDAFLVARTSFHADPAWWVEKVETLVSELEERRATGKGGRPHVRLLVTGSPILWPDFKLLQTIAATGADVVADEMCSASQRLYHPTVVDEVTRGGLIRAVAEKALLPCTCPCFGSSGARWDRLLELVESFHVDGVIHHTLRLCQLFDIDALGLSKKFRARGIPFINLHAEFDPIDSAGLKNRIEAFVEMIAAR